LPGVRKGHLASLFREAGLHHVESSVLSADLEHSSFESWWQRCTEGVGPAGVYVAGLSPGRRAELRERCRASLPDGPFTVGARGWGGRGEASYGRSPGTL